MVKFKILIDSHIQKNKDFLRIINLFLGVFQINIKEEDVMKMALEFVEKIKSLERKLNVTKDIYEDFKKKLDEAHQGMQNNEEAHLSHQQVLDLFKEDLDKMKVLFDDIIEEIKAIKKKYETDQPDVEETSPTQIPLPQPEEESESHEAEDSTEKPQFEEEKPSADEERKALPVEEEK